LLTLFFLGGVSCTPHSVGSLSCWWDCRLYKT
jgi:hypothetical protein